MFKSFLGYQLVEKYQNRKKDPKYTKSILSTALRIAIPVIASLLILLVPESSFGIEGLTIIEKRVIAVFVFATLMWILEGVSAWVTSTIVIVLLLFTCSDSALWLFRQGYDVNELGTLIKYNSLLNCYADPIIMLFLGGFILAIAATKTGMDGALARILLKPFGTHSNFVLLGFIVVTGIFSMFLSNTATAAMMLTFLAPVLKALPADGKGKIALAMAIPVAANVGGLGTPIGTPPNAIALKYLNDPSGLNLNMGFGEWMFFMLPFTIVVLFLGWLLLMKLFPFKQKKIVLNIEGEAKKDWRSIVVYITFAITVLLWVTDKYTGVNSNVVAMLPIGVFCAIGIIGRRDLEEINWSVLWMVAGGFALGVALNETGLAKHLITAIPFHTWPVMAVLIGGGILCYVMSNFISNTASAALLVPILGTVGRAMGEQMEPFGGVAVMLIGVAIGSSMAMILPISTPPNALAHSTGFIDQKDMMKVGIGVGIIGLVLGYTMLILLGSNGLI
ncbi:MAG: SLC13/DASS family transporter [Bacteroidales bacterium]|nr:SLC13/DASS family transporter [Bacteroidales bacterium]